MNDVGIVVEDLAATIEFFRALGLELEDQAMAEGEWRAALPDSASSVCRGRHDAHAGRPQSP